ncbi:anthranilate phosphoribosyltransferase [Sphingorhabdus sp. IMCC26285]|uniref:Anthranilate phosphoribosyltransferase n=1 Tax=Sphingorhabdus profundilacus TaxID=2509718 RepID=A0A6I4M3U1_9SPHN|nr:anthranilate phosphoribosyltransferase [Sphingorhabdus profundilacus]MVZ97005.1 anthranilate phosphoribosyltransferase [Sphingorhabdus profundilacus]
MTILPDASAPLTADVAAEAFGLILDGKAAACDIQQFLTILSNREETSIEIAAAVREMRKRMIAIEAPAGTIDVCGTGGDGSHSLNISTAVAIVVAACDVPVAKHGNRAASSKSGAADTLEALGLNLDRASDTAQATLADLGICFLFAQKHHPALGALAPIRKAIGKRTIFNLTGPAANPAMVKRQLIGVARPDFLSVYAGALDLLGYDDAMLVAGDEPLDELSISGTSSIVRLGQTMVRITPETAGLPRHPVEDLKGGDAAYNAAALTRLLDGGTGAYRDAVLLNAAAALMVAGVVNDWHSGIEEAAEAIDKGLAKTLLRCWMEY